jgi:hypothetical protein
VVVHNPAAVELVRKHAPAVRIIEIPHLFQTPPLAHKTDLGLPAGAVLLGLFGHLRESKRVLQVLRTMSRLPVKAHLLVAGNWVSRDLGKAAEPYLQHPRIHRIGFTPEKGFWGLAHATSICINLRYPSAGETSGIGIRLMGIGRAVLATRGPELARFPEGSYLPIEGGLAECSMLDTVLHWLIESPDAVHEIGVAAAKHIAVHHSPESVAALYWQALKEVH